MIIRIDYPQSGVRLDLWGGTSGAFAGLDPFDRVIDQRWQNNAASTPADIDRYQYGYDQDSNRLYKANVVGTPVVSGGLDEHYAYDPLNRLTQMQRGVLNSAKTGISGTPAREMDWTLDSTGNWPAYVTLTGGTTDLNQSRTSNPVNEITNLTESTGPTWVTPAYDAAGNTTTMPQVADPTQSFTATYDAWNRMTSVSASGTAVGRYQYDGRNRRAVKLTYSGGTLSETRHFYFSNPWQDIEERVGTSTSMDKQYVWGRRYIDELICRDDATPQRLYACQDANFNLTSITDSSGNVQERYRFDPYGARTLMNPSWATIASSAYNWVIGHQGLIYESETGLIYCRVRQIHALIGTFLMRDPLGNAHGVNLYQYLNSNSIIHQDASGLKCYSVVKKGKPPSRGPLRMIVDENSYVERECCCTLYVLVDFERLNIVDDIMGTSNPGHAAVGIEDSELYDYGGVGGSAFNTPGTPWWMNNFPSMPKLLSKLSSVASGDFVVVYKLIVSQHQCEEVRQYWKYKLAHLGTYNALTNSCASSVTDSLIDASIIPMGGGALFPSDVSDILEMRGSDSCGPTKGRAPALETIDLRNKSAPPVIQKTSDF